MPPAASTSAQGAATRLLILGCVRIFQPVHGYFLRRELVSWEVDDWAHVHPGSIYHALKSLTRDGLLEEVPAPAGSPRPTRTLYRLTADGEQDFLTLLRAGLLTLDDPVLFLTAITMAPALSRSEVLAAVERRAALLEEVAALRERMVEAVLRSPETPDMASEVPRVLLARTRAELDWAHDYLRRVRAGAYAFDGEPADWTPTPEQVDAVLVAGVGPGAAPGTRRSGAATDGTDPTEPQDT